MPRKEGKRIFSLFFLGPNLPRLAFGSLGPPNNFKAKGPACLGELTASGLSKQAATVPRWPFAYI